MASTPTRLQTSASCCCIFLLSLAWRCNVAQAPFTILRFVRPHTQPLEYLPSPLHHFRFSSASRSSAHFQTCTVYIVTLYYARCTLHTVRSTHCMDIAWRTIHAVFTLCLHHAPYTLHNAHSIHGTLWERVHSAHRLGHLHSFRPPIGTSQKGTTQQYWHPESSQEMGIT